MEFESPDVMKDFPGLYAPETNKKASNDSDYSDETDKLAKKDLLKRKEKKDKKDKERGYAALEGESSADENDSSPSKIKKSKTFKFTTSKSKEKREKSREKEHVDKDKKEKKSDKDKDKKEKVKADKKERKCKSADEHADIADGMPIFGVPLDVAVERSRCHDGIDIPLPVRACINFVQSQLTMEGVYKLSGTKARVIQLRKLYNQREHVDLTEHEIPTATSLLKLFLRDLPEPLFTNEMLVRFEEAGAILNVGTREKHLRTLVENLPTNNRLLLSWLLIHLDDVVLNERLNKMGIRHVVEALAPALHTSNRLLTALLHHCRALFPTTILEPYIPPLSSSAQLPTDLLSSEIELKKQESLLNQIHAEMNAGYITKTREELLWEVQRIITQLKRKIKNLQKEEEKSKEEPKPLSQEVVLPKETISVELHQPEPELHEDEDSPPSVAPVSSVPVAEVVEDSPDSSPPTSNTTTDTCIGNEQVVPVDDSPDKSSPQQPADQSEVHRKTLESAEQSHTDEAIALLQIKHAALLELREKLTHRIQEERSQIETLRIQLRNSEHIIVPHYTNDGNMDEIMGLLEKENQILEINKINLVRQIMEQEEMCVDLRAKMILISN